MGICDSNTSKPNNRQKRQEKQHIQPQQPQKVKETPLRPITDYILSESLAKRTNIANDFILSNEILGEGASGMVCQGTDPSGNKYAIKRINKYPNKALVNFLKEAEISISLSHEHIIKCYSIYEDLKMISFVLELAEGGDLFDFISKAPIGEIPYEASIDIIIQILETLSYLHNEKGIVHRDIKPENFMVCIDNGSPIIKLIDFGLATQFNPEERLMDYVGTPQFAAPEIIAKKSYDEKVDIWSAGVILYNMLTGYEPFYSEYRSQLDEQIMYRDIRFEKIQNSALRALCKGMLTRDPKKRLSAIDACNIAREIRNHPEQLVKEDSCDNMSRTNTKCNTFESICEKYRISTEKADKLQYIATENNIKDFMSFEGFYHIQLFRNQMTGINYQ